MEGRHPWKTQVLMSQSALLSLREAIQAMPRRGRRAVGGAVLWRGYEIQGLTICSQGRAPGLCSQDGDALVRFQSRSLNVPCRVSRVKQPASLPDLCGREFRYSQPPHRCLPVNRPPVLGKSPGLHSRSRRLFNLPGPRQAGPCYCLRGTGGETEAQKD